MEIELWEAPALNGSALAATLLRLGHVVRAPRQGSGQAPVVVRDLREELAGTRGLAERVESDTRPTILVVDGPDSEVAAIAGRAPHALVLVDPGSSEAGCIVALRLCELFGPRR